MSEPNSVDLTDLIEPVETVETEDTLTSTNVPVVDKENSETVWANTSQAQQRVDNTGQTSGGTRKSKRRRRTRKSKRRRRTRKTKRRRKRTRKSKRRRKK